MSVYSAPLGSFSKLKTCQTFNFFKLFKLLKPGQNRRNMFGNPTHCSPSNLSQKNTGFHPQGGKCHSCKDMTASQHDKRTHHATSWSFLLHQLHCSFICLFFFALILCLFKGKSATLVESKGKWKWRKAQLVCRGMRGSFWLVQIIFFIVFSWRDWVMSPLFLLLTKLIDKRSCLFLQAHLILQIVPLNSHV